MRYFLVSVIFFIDICYISVRFSSCVGMLSWSYILSCCCWNDFCACLWRVKASHPQLISWTCKSCLMVFISAAVWRCSPPLHCSLHVLTIHLPACDVFSLPLSARLCFFFFTIFAPLLCFLTHAINRNTHLRNGWYWSFEMCSHTFLSTPY